MFQTVRCVFLVVILLCKKPRLNHVSIIGNNLRMLLYHCTGEHSKNKQQIVACSETASMEERSIFIKITLSKENLNFDKSVTENRTAY